MKSAPLVSVVMAVYNGEPYLREAIASVLGQTFGDFEFIIVNDGSTDKSEAIIRSYADPRIRLTSQTNHGLVYSLNRGLELATGTFVARMDADDMSMPERFATEIEALESDPAISVVGTAIQRIDEAGRPLRIDYYLAHDTELRQDLLVRNPFAHGSIMMRRALVQRVGAYRPEFWPAEDYDLWRRMAAVGKLANSLKPLYCYRENAKGLSATHDSPQMRMAERISGELLADRDSRKDIPLKRCLASYDEATADARSAAVARIIENYYRVLAACGKRGNLLAAAYRFAKLASSGPTGFEFAQRKLMRQFGAVPNTKNGDRVLIFTTARVFGGGEVYVDSIANGLHEEFRISVLANRQVLGRIHAPIHKLALGKFPDAIERHVRGGYRLKQMYYYLGRGTRSAFEPSNANLVHFQIYDEWLLNQLIPRLARQGIPRLITMHTEFTPRDVAAKHLHVRETLGSFSAVVCVCGATKKNLVSLGVPEEKCVVIHNGVDTKRFIPSESPGTFITWVGRVDEQDKNAMLFVRIAELAQNCHLPLQFRIVGEGPLVPFIREYMASKRMENLHLYGWAQDMRQVYQEARVVCMTSTSEALPLVLSEAMASGVPVVSSDVGGIPELIKDPSVGSLVTSYSAEDFLKAIVSLYENADHYAEVRRNARAWVQQAFSLDRMLDEVRKLYGALLSSRGSD